MGILLTRFKKKKTTLEVLECLEASIKNIEEFRVSTEQRYRTIVGHLVLYSVGLYVLAAFVFYFYFFPASLSDQLFYIIPLLIFPIIIVLLKRLVSWYYQRKIARNQNKLQDMRKQKKQLLEDVMDKETYKVAKEILEKFAPDQLRKGISAVGPSPLTSGLSTSQLGRSLAGSTRPGASIPSVPVAPFSDSSELRHRSLQRVPNLPSNLSSSGPLVSSRQIINGQGFGKHEASQTSPIGREVRGENSPPGPPMPRPILPLQRGILDRLVEYLVGDGPSNRYALICRQCESHNGMALKEEFEYISFRCCYCYYCNHARKQRPPAPRLEQLSPSHTSASELESASSTAEESEEESGSQGSPQAEMTNGEEHEAKQERGHGDTLTKDKGNPSQKENLHESATEVSAGMETSIAQQATDL